MLLDHWGAQKVFLPSNSLRSTNKRCFQVQQQGYYDWTNLPNSGKSHRSEMERLGHDMDA